VGGPVVGGTGVDERERDAGLDRGGDGRCLLPVGGAQQRRKQDVLQQRPDDQVPADLDEDRAQLRERRTEPAVPLGHGERVPTELGQLGGKALVPAPAIEERAAPVPVVRAGEVLVDGGPELVGEHGVSHGAVPGVVRR
jgi:hypothetical protein